MQVLLQSGHTIDDLSPIRFDKTPRPRPQFWANTVAEVIERGIERAGARIPRTGNVRCSPEAFGWGDAGLRSIAVYEPIGDVLTLTKGDTTTWTICILHHQCYGLTKPAPVIEFTTARGDVALAKQLAVEALA